MQDQRKSSDGSNIIKFHKVPQVNIAVVIFGIMFVYVIFHIFSSLTAKDITVYEVNQGTIAANEEYQALALRQEEIVYAPIAGDIFYFAPNISRAGVRTSICSIDTEGTITKQLANSISESVAADDLDFSQIASSINTYALDYSDMDFQKVYTFKNHLNTELQQLSSEYLLDQNAQQVAQAASQGTFQMLNAATPGLVLYQTDGMETVTPENFTDKDLNASNLTVTDLKSQGSVLAGQAAYKLITSDHWNLIMSIDKETAEEFADTGYIEVRFKEDQATTWASCEVIEKTGKYYLNLSLYDSLDRYAASRYLRIELLKQEETGLKIPNSAITTKEFFTIPKSYFYRGNNSGSKGVLVDGSDSKDAFVTPTLYYETEDYYYVDANDLSAGTKLRKPDSSETYVVGSETATLEGVYNVNKGYAVFKQIEILYQTKEYSIVKSGTSYGIALYDHIALEGDHVRENDML